MVLTPAPLSGLIITTNPVIGGQATTATITLSGKAGAGGDVIKLLSSNAIATVPTTVTVLAGQSSATFTIHTVAVTASKVVAINAVYGASTVSRNLTISP